MKLRLPNLCSPISLLLLFGAAVISGREASDTGTKGSTPQLDPRPESPAVAGATPLSAESLMRELNKAQEEGRWNEAEAMLGALLSREPELKDDLRAVTASIQLNRSLEEEKWDAAEKHLDEWIQIEPQAKTSLLAVRIQILAAKGDMKQAVILSRKALADEKDRCLLHAIASALLDAYRGPQRDIVVLAHELALAANKGDLVGDCRAGHLSVLAQAEFLLGRKSQAVAIAVKALRLADDPEMKKSIEASLSSYKSGSVSKNDAEKAPPPSSWTDDFSDVGTLTDNWRPYGFLAAGIDAKHPLGKTVSGKDARPEWWQIVDGVLRGQCFPEEKHPPGLRRAISGNDIRLHCRFKMAAEGQIGISIGGPNPIVEKDFNVAGLHIRADGITAWDNDVLHPKGSPEAAELKAKGIWNRKFFYSKSEKLQIAPDVWHNLAVELRGKELRITLDGKLALTYTTLCGDVPKNDIGLQSGGKCKTPIVSWFDDIRIEALHADEQTPQ